MSNKKTRNHKKGFTLIELLVVIAIIGLLATIAVVSLNSSRARARDSKRVSDIRQIQTALELYHQEHQSYPEGEGLAHEVLSIEEYIAPIPEAPTPADGNCDTENNTYHYEKTEDGKSYQLSYCIGASTGSLEPGYSYATPLALQGGIHPSFTCGDDVEFTYNGDTVTYGSVENAVGDCYLDRNLGADPMPFNPATATGMDDTRLYGDLFQWGRLADGHQIRTSGETSTLSSSDDPGHGDFITHTSSPWDWRDPQKTGLWQGVDGINNPCPSGWRLPTETELNAERGTWGSNDSSGAYASDLRWPVAGYRDVNGLPDNVGSAVYVWSSTVFSSYSRSLSFNSSGASINSVNRAYGRSVRCLRD